MTETAGSATPKLGAENFITDTASEHTDSEDKSAPAELAELSRSTEAEISLVEEGETEQPGDATDLELKIGQSQLNHQKMRRRRVLS